MQASIDRFVHEFNNLVDTYKGEALDDIRNALNNKLSFGINDNMLYISMLVEEKKIYAKEPILLTSLNDSQNNDIIIPNVGPMLNRRTPPTLSPRSPRSPPTVVAPPTVANPPTSVRPPPNPRTTPPRPNPRTAPPRSNPRTAPPRPTVPPLSNPPTVVASPSSPSSIASSAINDDDEDFIEFVPVDITPAEIINANSFNLPRSFLTLANTFKSNGRIVINARILRLSNTFGVPTSSQILGSFTSNKSLAALIGNMGTFFKMINSVGTDMLFYRRLCNWYCFFLKNVLLNRGVSVQDISYYMVTSGMIDNNTVYAERIMEGSKCNLILSAFGVAGFLSIELFRVSVLRTSITSVQNFIEYLIAQGDIVVTDVEIPKDIKDLFITVPTLLETLS